MIRNSIKYVSYKALKEVCQDLRSIYGAMNEEEVIEVFDDFGRKWNGK